MLTQLSGCNLDGERNAIDARANPLDRSKIFEARLETALGQPASFDEKMDGRGLPRAVLRTCVQGRALLDRFALYAERTPAGGTQRPVPAGRTELRGPLSG